MKLQNLLKTLAPSLCKYVKRVHVFRMEEWSDMTPLISNKAASRVVTAEEELEKQEIVINWPNASFCCERSHHCERRERPQSARQQQAPLGRGATWAGKLPHVTLRDGVSPLLIRRGVLEQTHHRSRHVERAVETEQRLPTLDRPPTRTQDPCLAFASQSSAEAPEGWRPVRTPPMFRDCSLLLDSRNERGPTMTRSTPSQDRIIALHG